MPAGHTGPCEMFVRVTFGESLCRRRPSRLVATAAGCRRNDLRRWPDGTFVEYIDKRSMKPLTIHRLVQKVV